VDRDEDAIGLVLDFLDYLPSHAGEEPPQRPALAPEGSAESLLNALPQRRSETYDVRVLLRGFVDEGTIFELKSEYGRSICTCLARIGGRTVGLIANNPRHLGGAINAEACNKAVSLIVLCDSFNIPLISVVDQPGFLVGKDGEQRGMLGRIMNWMTALELASVPKVCLITRKSYGQAYLNMGGGRNSDVVITWPSADLGFTDVEVGRRVLTGGADHDKKDIAGALDNIDSSCWPLAEAYESHMVIDPRDTRGVLQEILAISGTASGLMSRERRLYAWPTSYV
jgi:methylmalonyl-CoA decarboxylase subunit alpha